MRSDFVLLESFADQNEVDKCDVTEAYDSELWEDVITAEHAVTTVFTELFTHYK